MTKAMRKKGGALTSSNTPFDSEVGVGESCSQLGCKIVQDDIAIVALKWNKTHCLIRNIESKYCPMKKMSK